MAVVSVVGSVRFAVDVYERVAGDLGSSVGRHTIDYTKAIASGTGADQADVAWSDERTVTAGAPEELDLRGVLASALNAGINFAKVTGVVIRNKSVTSGQTLLVGNAPNAFFTGLFGSPSAVLRVGPSGTFAWYSPVDPASTTPGTADQLRIDATSGSIVYQIVILGRTA